MKKDKVINFGQLPVLKHGDIIIEERCARAARRRGAHHGSANILEYVADLADQRKLGANGNRYTGADNIERFAARGNAQAVRARVLHTGADMSQAEAFFTQAKTWLGVTGVPDGFLEKTLPEWFGYFQGVLAKNDDGDVRTDEFCYGKVAGCARPAPD